MTSLLSDVQIPGVDEYLARLRDDFRVFLAEVWRHVKLPPPSLVQYDIAHWLQHGPTRRGIQGFRGVSKTWVTIAYLLWRLFKNANERILLASQSMDHCKASLFMARRWLETVPFLSHMIPLGVRKGKQRDSATFFDIRNSEYDRVATVRAVGITGQLPGGRSSLVIPDDVETMENTYTRDQRYRLRNRVTEFENILLPEGEIIYLGTPHHEESLYEYLAEECGYSFRSWPSRYPGPHDDIPYLSPMIRKRLDAGDVAISDSLWPERFSNEWLTAKELAIGKSIFAMQFQLIRGMADENLYPLKLSDFIVFPVNLHKAPQTIAWGQRTNTGSTAIEDIPSVGFGTDGFYGPIMQDDTWLPYSGCRAFIDPAGTGTDEMAWAIIGQLHGNLYVKSVGAVTGGANDKNLTAIVEDLKRHRATEVYVETNFGGEMLIQLLRPIIARASCNPGENKEIPEGWNCSIEGVHSSGQKELRIIHTLEPPMNQHRLIIDPEVAADKVLMKQLTRMRTERGCLEHDDRVDALAGCVARFAGLLDQDDAHMAEESRFRDYEAWIRKHQPHTIGPAPTWIRH